jgi:hypothetical protein
MTMKIHTNTLTEVDIYRAARFARVDVVTLTRHASRSRDYSFSINLEGESRRRPNRQSDVSYGSGYAATWDQWGVFLSVLFDLDGNGQTFEPSAPAFVGSAKNPVYASREAFHRQTSDRFRPGGIVGVGRSTNANVINVAQHDGPNPSAIVHRIAGSYWPADSHGDHTFRWAGVPCEQACTKCSAVKRWTN